mgnify:CR=1 FL=1
MQPPQSPQRVASLWMGSDIGWIESLCLSSFLNRGFQVEVFSYEPVPSLPSEIIRRDAREILPAPFRVGGPDYAGKPTGFSNVFRYELLAKTDAIWVDADMLALQSRIPLRKGFVFAWESQSSINGAVLGAPSSSTLLDNLRQKVTSLDLDSVAWGQIGPRLITATVHALDMESFVLPQSAIYPIPWLRAWEFFDPSRREEMEEAVSSSIGVHLWNEVISRAPYGLRFRLPPKGSFLRSEAEKFGLLRTSLPDVAPSEIKTWSKQLKAVALKKSLRDRVRRASRRRF